MNNQNEIQKLTKRVKLLEDLVQVLMSRGSLTQSQINQIQAYLAMLKNDFGLNAANRDMFRKLLYEYGKLKEYYDSTKMLTKLSNKLQHLTFNLEQQTSYYTMNSLYNLNTQDKSFYFEFNLIMEHTQLFLFSSKENDMLNVSVNPNDIRAYDISRSNQKVKTVIVINNEKFKDILTNKHSFNYVPIIFEFDVTNYNLYIYQAIVYDTKMEYKRIFLFTITNSNDFTLLKDAMCYVGISNVLPDAYKVNIEGAFKLRVKNAMMIVSEEERNLPYAGYTGLSGLQGYSYLKDLSSHLIESRSYSYSQSGQSVIMKLGSIHVSQLLNESMILESEIIFQTNDLIIAGLHDNNDRVYDQNRFQNVYIFPISRFNKMKIAYDEKLGPSTMIIIEGNDYFDIPIVIIKTDEESKRQVKIDGFVRFTQSLNSIELNTIHSVSNGEFKDISYISCASLDYNKSEKLDDGTYDITYMGNQYGLGFGDITNRHVDSYIVLGLGSFTLHGRVYIDERHAISIEPTEGEFTYEFNNVTTTKQATFHLRQENDHGLVKTYFASVDTFDIEISREIGIQIQSNDSNNKDELFITKADKDGNAMVAYDNRQDKILYTPRDDEMKVERDDAFRLFFVNHMVPKITNINCIELVDNVLFGHRELPSQLLLSPRVDANEFGWNGMMKSNVNTWSRTGYLDKRPITIKTNLSWDGWNVLDGKFPKIKQQNRHDQNFDSRQFIITDQVVLPHVVYIQNLENWNYQPDAEFNFKLLELGIKNVNEVSSEAIDNIFDTNVDLSRIQTEIELIFKTQKDIITHLSDLEYKVNKVIEVVQKIGEVLDNLIKSLKQMQSHDGPSFIQDLFNIGIFLLEMIAPEIVLFIAPFALLLVGTASLITGDIQGGIMDLIGGGIIAAYYHIPLYVIPYGKRLINYLTTYKSVSHNFLNYTKRIGNSIRKYLPSLNGFYDVRANQLRLRREQYTYTLDTYTQRYELVELDLWNPQSRNAIYEEDVKRVKNMTFKITRIFRVHDSIDTKKLNTIVGTVTMNFKSGQSVNKLKSKRKLRSSSILNLGDDNIVSVTFNLQFRNRLDSTGLFKFVNLDRTNFKNYINTDMNFKFLSESIMIAILFDAKMSITHMTQEIADYLDGLVEIAIDRQKLERDYHIVGLINPHVNYNNMKSSSDILYSTFGILNKEFPFHSGTD